MLADVLRFVVILSVTTAPSVYDLVFTTAPSVYETGSPQYESTRDILLLRIALAECFIWCFVDDMLLVDVLRFVVILLVTTAPRETARSVDEAKQVVFFRCLFVYPLFMTRGRKRLLL